MPREKILNIVQNHKHSKFEGAANNPKALLNIEKKESFPYRSKSAQQIHGYVMAACKSNSSGELNAIIKKLRDYIQCINSDYLLETSINQCTHFHDILHLPFAIQKNLEWGQTISSALWEVLFTRLELRRPEKIHDVLMRKTNDGFMPLQQALASGSEKNVTAVIKLLKKDREALKVNLKNRTTDGFMPLQQALTSGGEKNVATVIGLLKEDRYVSG